MEKTLNEVFRNRVKKYGDKLCVEKKLNGKWETATWNEYFDRSRLTSAYATFFVSVILNFDNRHH